MVENEGVPMEAVAGERAGLSNGFSEGDGGDGVDGDGGNGVDAPRHAGGAAPLRPWSTWAAVRTGPGGWSPGAVRLLAFGLVAFQVVQGSYAARANANDPFVESYYLITYRHGFVRHGLLGEVLRLVGAPTTDSTGKFASFVVAGVMDVAHVVAIELLIRQRSTASAAMAVLLAASPFCIDFALVDRRPDLMAIALLVVLGLVVTRVRSHQVAWLAAVGVGFGAMVLVHEDVALIELPWAVVLVAVATLGRTGRMFGGPGDGRADPADCRAAVRLTARLVALGAAPFLAALAVLLSGVPSPGQVTRLRADVVGFSYKGQTEFDYLRQTLSQSFHLVGSMPRFVQRDTMAVGLVLVALQVIWVVRWVTPGVWEPFTQAGNRAVGAFVAVIVSGATVLLFATGFDWLRWFCDCGASWLVVQAFAVLVLVPSPRDAGAGRRAVRQRLRSGERATRSELAILSSGAGDGGSGRGDPRGQRIPLPAWLPAAAVYLAAMPPLAAVATGGPFHPFFFFV